VKHEYTVDLTSSGINKLIGKLGGYKIWLLKKTDEVAKRLADIGAADANFRFANAYYDGDNDVVITVKHNGIGKYTVSADGEAVLFIEFGAGYKYGYGHPEPQGLGPGTYPGKGHWDDPNGWYLPKKVQEETGIEKSYGNPPAAAMYNTVKDLEGEIDRIVREVFQS
jgi:hypothetical protein